MFECIKKLGYLEIFKKSGKFRNIPAWYDMLYSDMDVCLFVCLSGRLPQGKESGCPIFQGFSLTS